MKLVYQEHSGPFKVTTAWTMTRHSTVARSGRMCTRPQVPHLSEIARNVYHEVKKKLVLKLDIHIVPIVMIAYLITFSDRY